MPPGALRPIPTMPHNPARRTFLKTSSLAAGAALIPAGLSAAGAAAADAAPAQTAPAKKKLRLASVGIGRGIGGYDLNQLSGHPEVQVVAVCDVDQRTREARCKQHGAKGYADYRHMLREMAGEIDAVHIATPDHMHAPIALLAMSLGKALYCQKPLANTVWEVRAMSKMAAEKKLITMMGNQKHAEADPCTAIAWIQAGVIGKVKSVHSRIAGKDWGGVRAEVAPTPAPEWMDWDRYLGVAPLQPWLENEFHTMNWRNRVGFGGGTQSDMGCHVFDVPFRALELTAPKTVVALGPKPEPNSFAKDSHTRYVFPGTKFTVGDEVEFNYYCGGIDIPKELLAGIASPAMGAVFVGEKGILCCPHANQGAFRVVNLDGSDMKDLPARQPGLNGGNHWHNFINAVLKGERTTDPIDGLGGLNSESAQMGILVNHWPSTVFHWDYATCQFTGDGPEVAAINQLVKPHYRDGWTAPGI